MTEEQRWRCDCDYEKNIICSVHEQDLKEIWLKQLRESDESQK